MTNRYTLLSLAIASSLFLVACNKSDPAQAGAGGAGAAQQMPPSVVNVMPVQFQTVPLVRKLSGRTVASQEAIVVPQASGIVTQQLFRQDSVVKQGQPLYRINADSYETAVQSSAAQVDQARANILTAEKNLANAQATKKSRLADLDLAEKNFNRYVTLKGTDAISKQEYDVAEAQVKTARVAVENADAQIGVAQANIDAAKATANSANAVLESNKINKNRTIVTAPLSGIIRKSNVDVGALVTAGQTQMTSIANSNNVFVDISQSANEILELQQQFRKGNVAMPTSAAVRLILPDGSTYPIMGQLSFADQQVDQATGAVTLRAVFKNNGALLPGMFVNAEVVQGQVNNAVLLPQSAINRTAKGETTVYIVGADNKIQARPVTVNGTYNGQWIVTDGLKQGENVVVVGGAKVKPDQQVEVKPYVPGEAAAAGSTNAPVAPTATPAQSASNGTTQTTTTTTTQQTVTTPNANPPATASTTAAAKQ